MIIAVLQARLSSSRLPAKVLKPILGEPMLKRQIERLKHSKTIDELIIATSNEPEDEAIANLAINCGVKAYKGSLNNVLDRVYQAASPYNPEFVIRLTGDCPLADWGVIDELVKFIKTGKYDYASNTLEPTWPDGLDAEIIKFSVLKTAWQEAKLEIEKEHVTPFIYNNSERFLLGNFKNNRDLSGLRWTVDEPEDFDFVTQIFSALYPNNSAFTTSDILTFLSKNPKIVAKNAFIDRNEGYKIALEKLKEINL